jgi:F-type H+-transporting ATPase subunit delta
LEERAIANRYARALVYDAEKTEQDWEIYRELTGIWEILSLDERLGQLVAHPNIDDSIKEEIVKKVALKNRSSLLVRLLKKLIERDRLFIIPQILEYLEREICRKEGVLLVVVHSARELSPEIKERLSAALKKKFGMEVRLKNIVDSSLIGGISLDLGDRVLNGTISGGLERLRQELIV